MLLPTSTGWGRQWFHGKGYPNPRLFPRSLVPWGIPVLVRGYPSPIWGVPQYRGTPPGRTRVPPSWDWGTPKTEKQNEYTVGGMQEDFTVLINLTNLWRVLHLKISVSCFVDGHQEIMQCNKKHFMLNTHYVQVLSSESG